MAGGLLAEERQGRPRHRYVRLAGDRAARLVEEPASYTAPGEEPPGTLRAASTRNAMARGRTCASWTATLNMVCLGVFPTALAFTTWAYAPARTTAGRMGATTYAVPALVVLMSWLFLDGVPGLMTLLGGAICLAGVAVSRSGSRAPARWDRAGDGETAAAAGAPGVTLGQPPASREP